METPADSRVKLYPDGKYRWVYEVPMLKNPTILFDVYKVLGISFGIVWLFNVLLISCEDGLNLRNLWSFTTGFLILMLVFLVIGYVAYFIVAWSYGWKYIVLFTLDEKEVVHQMMPRQMEKAKVLGALTALIGSVAGKPGVMGAGVLAASRSTSTSVLAKVARLVPRRRLHLIKVNQLLNKNRVFVPDEDFDFVYNFLCQHCPKAKKKEL
ncbi:MAG: hypothetical protein IKQ03_04140 [Prevotella sp.]|nr:hypothetical protein [Prevotella sp.]